MGNIVPQRPKRCQKAAIFNQKVAWVSQVLSKIRKMRIVEPSEWMF
jgi:hypothetical protein